MEDLYQVIQKTIKYSQIVRPTSAQIENYQIEILQTPHI